MGKKRKDTGLLITNIIFITVIILVGGFWSYKIHTLKAPQQNAQEQDWSTDTTGHRGAEIGYSNGTIEWYLMSGDKRVITVDTTGVAVVPKGWIKILILRDNKIWVVDTSRTFSVFDSTNEASGEPKEQNDKWQYPNLYGERFGVWNVKEGKKWKQQQAKK